MPKSSRLMMAGAALLALCAMPPRSMAAAWITHPAAVSADREHRPVALQFRRELDLATPPSHLWVRVSADNRFILYVNGRRIADGPARGDLGHWRYERVDLAPHLARGHNVIAAEVWNDARLAPGAQISARTGFLLAAEDAKQNAVDSGAGWRVRVDPSRSVSFGFAQIMKALGPLWYTAGPPETLSGAKRHWDWNQATTSASDWSSAVDVLANGEAAPWTLMPDPLPAMTYKPAPAGKVVRAKGVTTGAFPEGPVRIPPHAEVAILLDAGRVQSAYPELITSGGRDAEIKVTYTEALYGPDKKRFADRNQVDDGQALGLTDSFEPDGGPNRVFQPFWWRTWRYVELHVKTGAEPLTLDRFSVRQTHYPFVQRARFVSSDPELNEIWRIGWDTVQLDAHETFMDTAYWEQLQYIGDSRLEALTAYAVSGDSRLGVQALDAFDDSRIVEGLPQAAWPMSGKNSIPPFALIWIGMEHDYWMREPDQAVLKRALPGVRSVLDWYKPYVRDNGLVRYAPGWQFIDWRPGLSEQPKRNEPPKPDSCIITLLYLGALGQAADLEGAVGDPAYVNADRAQADRVRRGVQEACWDSGRGLYADTPDKTSFSQHANALAVLYDVAPPERRRAILDQVTVQGHGIDAPPGVTGVTYYFAYYLARALDHAGLGDRYLDLMQTWRALLAKHFTTWPEESDPSRSDSHAWSAHPTLDLLSVVAGIEPSAPGFAAVRIAPHLGDLKTLDAAMAHPAGLIEARYVQGPQRLQARIKLPNGLSGEFVWAGRTLPLHPGVNEIALPRP